MFNLIILYAIFEIISRFRVTNAYDTCYPGYDYSFSFRCYGENELCCNSDFDCCDESLQTGQVIGIIVGCILGLGLLCCICGACKIKHKQRRPPTITQRNQRLQVSSIAYNNERSQTNPNFNETSIEPAPHESEPPPYSTIQGDFSKPPPYCTIQGDFSKPPPYSSIQGYFSKPPPYNTIQGDF